MKSMIENIVYIVGISSTGVLVHHEMYGFAAVVGLAIIVDAISDLKAGGETDEYGN